MLNKVDSEKRQISDDTICMRYKEIKQGAGKHICTLFFSEWGDEGRPHLECSGNLV